MSSNRLKYDSCAYVQDIKESTQPLQYNLFVGKYENNNACPMRETKSFQRQKTEVESELLGINHPASKCRQNITISGAKMCDSIYYIPPNNIEKPTSNMLPSMTNKNIEKFTDMSTYEKYLKCRYVPSKKTADCLSKCKEDDIVCRRPCVDIDVNAWMVCHKNLDITNRYDIGCIDDMYDRCMKNEDINSSYNNLLKCLDEMDIKKCDTAL